MICMMMIGFQRVLQCQVALLLYVHIWMESVMAVRCNLKAKLILHFYAAGCAYGCMVMASGLGISVVRPHADGHLQLYVRCAAGHNGVREASGGGGALEPAAVGASSAQAGISTVDMQAWIQLMLVRTTCVCRLAALCWGSACRSWQCCCRSWLCSAAALMAGSFCVSVGDAHGSVCWTAVQPNLPRPGMSGWRGSQQICEHCHLLQRPSAALKQVVLLALKPTCWLRWSRP